MKMLREISHVSDFFLKIGSCDYFVFHFVAKRGKEVRNKNSKSKERSSTTCYLLNVEHSCGILMGPFSTEARGHSPGGFQALPSLQHITRFVGAVHEMRCLETFRRLPTSDKPKVMP